VSHGSREEEEEEEEEEGEEEEEEEEEQARTRAQSAEIPSIYLYACENEPKWAVKHGPSSCVRHRAPAHPPSLRTPLLPSLPPPPNYHAIPPVANCSRRTVLAHRAARLTGTSRHMFVCMRAPLRVTYRII
jgi:hypothetical protein